ncbi:MAG: leucine-rich repeat domain-containing protein, partial [Holosporales bacterium]|nr:leucine-rich repeat domain-containing protein [Holosporales bacterium]
MKYNVVNRRIGKRRSASGRSASWRKAGASAIGLLLALGVGNVDAADGAGEPVVPSAAGAKSPADCGRRVTVVRGLVHYSYVYNLNEVGAHVLIPRSITFLSHPAYLTTAYPTQISQNPAVCVDIVFETGSKLRKMLPCAFAHSALRHIRIPASVELVGDWCFKESRLRSIVFEETNDAQPPEVVIGQDVFYGTSVQTIRFRENTVLSCNTLKFSGLDCVNMPCVFGSATPLEEPLDDEFLRTINMQPPFEARRMIITRRFSLPDRCCANRIIRSIFFKPGCKVLVLG